MANETGNDPDPRWAIVLLALAAGCYSYPEGHPCYKASPCDMYDSDTGDSDDDTQYCGFCNG